MLNQKSKFITFFLCLLYGALGLHRFYTGKVWTGLLYLFTAGLFGIGIFFDIFAILLNTYRDKDGLFLKNDLPTSLIILFIILYVAICIVLATLGVFADIFHFVFDLFGIV